MTALIAVLAGVSGAVAALLVLYANQRLHLGSTGYGLLFCCYAVGGLIGSVSAPKMLKGGSVGRALIVDLPVGEVPWFCLPDGAEQWSEATRLSKNPVSAWWRSAWVIPAWAQGWWRHSWD